MQSRGTSNDVVIAIALVIATALVLSGCASEAAGPASSPATLAVGLDTPRAKDIAMQLVSSAENSSLDWKSQYAYIEDIDDARGYTGGIIGFTSGTGDMLELVEGYTATHPESPLAPFVQALRDVNGSDAHTGLGEAFTDAWSEAAEDPDFDRAQDDLRDRWYFDPAVEQAKADGLHALGQFIYYDAIVMHGPGDGPDSFSGIRTRARERAPTPANGGDESDYLEAFLDVRTEAMQAEAAHNDTSRVDTAQRTFLRDDNLDLLPPLAWHVYGDAYQIG